MSKKSIDSWSNMIMNSKTEVLRIYRKDDVNKTIPFIFNGWSKDFETREDMISIHTKTAENEYGNYLTYVMNKETFDKNFVEVLEWI